ncbi:uncharacterized protein B0H18DRAFT_1089889 [Fomitopsis serialis]|uniref:uncharacterized protein n=1 Tax=Fomitopsis serialis TaxID=139415 RepID=UPI002008E56A|nr:uncharacterized protein B0H18DRAFT_1089889 [Neoantrodia serialis]KAH9910432.1 hypothetical protein B0H18DRAFT_1089889 [Neoantrodia serialis]
MLRESELEGISVEGTTERIIASLFADDTMVYLRDTDNIHVLTHILNTFCVASTAQFNVAKTEYLPVGPKDYRTDFVESKTLGGQEFPPGGRFVKDGESMRTLGAWWNTILEKQQQIMDVWQKTHPSYKGKELLTKALVVSRSFYLASVNGMPMDVEATMKKQIRDFLWEGRKQGYLPWNSVISPRAHGGLNMPDISARLDAINIHANIGNPHTGNQEL